MVSQAPMLFSLTDMDNLSLEPNGKMSIAPRKTTAPPITAIPIILEGILFLRSSSLCPLHPALAFLSYRVLARPVGGRGTGRLQAAEKQLPLPRTLGGNRKSTRLTFFHVS